MGLFIHPAGIQPGLLFLLKQDKQHAGGPLLRTATCKVAGPRLRSDRNMPTPDSPQSSPGAGCTWEVAK